MYKYIGDGKWLPGIPARDLTDVEAEQHGVKESALYKRVTAPPKADKGKGETKA